MKLYLVTNDGELLETWENVEESFLLSPTSLKLQALEIKERIKSLKDYEKQ